MRVAALYDVHGNLPALEAVLADPRCRNVDTLVCGGDVCAGPMPVEVLGLMQEHHAVFVRGNADRELHGWPAEQLSADQREALRSWPTTVTLDVEGLGAVVFCHGSPRADDEILTRVTPDEVVEDACRGLPFVVGGHTHVQFDRRSGATRMVNAGSVGMPYEGRRGAFWAVIGPDLELVSTDYDFEAAAVRIRATRYPQADEVIDTLTNPPSADEATAIFEGQRGT